MNIIDIIILILSVYFFIIGWQKGFLRTIFGPISLIIGSIVGFIYYQQTHNLFVSLLIGLVGPFILNLILNLLIKIWQKTTDEEKENFTVGRLLGAISNLTWGLSLSALILFVTAVIPITIPGIKQVQDSINKSRYYDFLNKIFSLEKQKEKIGLTNLQTILNDPEKIAQFQESDAFKKLMKNEKMQKVFNNKNTIYYIQNNNFSALFKDPDFINLMKDKELNAEILSAYKDILKFEKKDEPKTLSP